MSDFVLSDKVVSVNGNTSFHVMGMIKVSTKSAAVTDKYLSSEIPRRSPTPADKAIILKAGDIPIKHWRDPRKLALIQSSLNQFMN